MSSELEILVFVGPTVEVATAQTILPARYLPPVSQGDVYAAAAGRPAAIAIIDGYFDRVPAVWHKEILWAMSRGIHVYGASSMGALRAVELEPFGMIGVGKIFEAFRSGELQDDDEVAVLHGPPASGYLALSDAMVDIRFTAAAAIAEGILSQQEADRLVDLAKSRFYAERNFSVLCQTAEKSGLAGAAERLARWLPQGRVAQKREDALELLRKLAVDKTLLREPKQVRYHFECTAMWEGLCAQGRRTLDHPSGAVNHLPNPAIEELRLEGPAYLTEKLRATVQLLALAEADRERLRVDEASHAEAAARLRSRFAMATEDQLDEWLRKQRIDRRTFERLVAHQVLSERVEKWLESLLPDAMRNQLILNGRYGTFMDRAEAKHRLLGELGLTLPSLVDAGLSEEDLWQSYFPRRLGESVPSDLEDYANRFGFLNLDAFRQAVLRECIFVARTESEQAAKVAEFSPRQAAAGPARGGASMMDSEGTRAAASEPKPEE